MLFDVDAEFAGAGAEEIAGDADVVAEVEQLVEREALFADGVEADVDLQPLAALLEVREAGFALPRMAMMRPATRTLMWLASSSSAVLGVYSSRIWGMVWVVSYL